MQVFFMEEFPFFFELDLSPTLHGYIVSENCRRVLPTGPEV
jgi:hypothetical protein